MQVSKKSLVLKPIQGDARGQREAEFFQTGSNSTDPAVRAFLEFRVPRVSSVAMVMVTTKKGRRPSRGS